MMMTRAARRRTLALAVAAGVAGAGCLGIVLADSAGAAVPAAGATRTQSTHIVAMAPASSAPTAQATGPAGATNRTSAAAHGIASTPGSAAGTASNASGASSIAGQAQQVQLAPAQLPALSAEKWVAVGAPSVRDIAGHDIGENECAKVDGANVWTQQAFSGGDGQNVAIQDTFVFTSTAGAQAAYQHIVTGMHGCQQTTRALQTANKVQSDASVTETATRSDAAAWERDWTGVMGMSAAGPQTNHFYVAVQGTRLIALQFTEFPGHAAPYNVSADPSVVAMLEAELAR
jgi:hypothetical protein